MWGILLTSFQLGGMLPVKVLWKLRRNTSLSKMLFMANEAPVPRRGANIISLQLANSSVSLMSRSLSFYQNESLGCWCQMRENAICSETCSLVGPYNLPKNVSVTISGATNPRNVPANSTFFLLAPSTNLSLLWLLIPFKGSE